MIHSCRSITSLGVFAEFSLPNLALTAAASYPYTNQSTVICGATWLQHKERLGHLLHLANHSHAISRHGCDGLLVQEVKR